MTWFGNAGHLLDVDVEHVSRSGMLITNNGNGGLERAGSFQFHAGEKAAHGGAAQPGGLNDAGVGPALAAEAFDGSCFFCGDATRRAVRTRGQVRQCGGTPFPKAAYPLGGRPAD